MLFPLLSSLLRPIVMQMAVTATATKWPTPTYHYFHLFLCFTKLIKITTTTRLPPPSSLIPGRRNGKLEGHLLLKYVFYSPFLSNNYLLVQNGINDEMATTTNHQHQDNERVISSPCLFFIIVSLQIIVRLQPPPL